MRSVKRVAHTISKDDQLAYGTFKSTGYHVLKADSEEAILALFQVLGGELPLDEAIAILPSSKVLETYSPHHTPNKWKPCQHWKEWWTRPRHLSKFVYASQYVLYILSSYLMLNIYRDVVVCHQ